MICPEKVPKKNMPYPIATFDIETDADFNVLDIGVCLKYPTVIFHSSTREFIVGLIEYMDKNGLSYLQLWGHNAGRFDIVVMLNEIISIPELSDISVLMSGNVVINWSLYIGNKRVDLSDSMRLINTSLKTASIQFDVLHKKIDIETLPHILKVKSAEAYFRYLRNDVLGLYEVLRKFVDVLEKEFGAFNKIYTAAGTAFHIFKRHLGRKIYTPKTLRLKNFEERVYRGAICHLESPGRHKDVTVLDVNSLYPFVMFENEYPVSERGYWTKKFCGERGLYICRLCSNKLSKSFPFLYGDNGLVRNRGETFFADHLTLNYLVRVGISFDVELGYIYLEWGNLFQYMGRLFELRKDPALKLPIKIVMNSSYGKFGQKIRTNHLALATNLRIDELKNKGVKYRDYGEMVMWEEDVDNPEKFDAIAACVLLQARLYMRSLIDIVELCCGVIYADTDSLHIPSKACPSLSAYVGAEIGCLKQEFVGDTLYLGKKLYVLYENEHYKGGIKSKGFSKATLHDMETAAKEGVQKIKYKRFFTLREGLLGAKKLIDVEKNIKPT